MKLLHQVVSQFTIVPIFFGNFINLETKKWNRITRVINDQIQTISNVMGVIGSIALGSADFEKQLDMYIYYSLIMYSVHNKCNALNLSPIYIRGSIISFVGKLLFVDKSMGGLK